MARKTRQRISYVLPLANSPGGHRLGVNGLAVDPDRSILYSGGRDGLICAWDLDLDLEQISSDTENPLAPLEGSSTAPSKAPKATIFRQQVQAHTHWVNDILLAQNNTALVSASSDITVKIWRPHSEESQVPNNIGLHSDYVKCLASPGPHSDWVASGGLDHKILLWDLNGGGEKLQIDVGENESNTKGSVYALSVRGSIMASGGPESIVRLWDPKSGKRITNFVGHTDNVRDILINQDGDTVMTASSDQSIKVWSITAGRCMNTLTMHNDSVWSLYSDHPQLFLFYSSDRSGLVAKTDVRGCGDMDEGFSLAIAQEHEGVNKMSVAGDYFWTATSSSSINRWRDVDTRGRIQSPEPLKHQRVSSIASRSRFSPSPTSSTFNSRVVNSAPKPKIPINCLLRISNNATLPDQISRDIEVATMYSSETGRKLSEAFMDQDLGEVLPFHDLPEETIEGQNGLIKHLMLNDRRRVLTLDTAGEVTMWDLLRCVPLQSFGKRHLEDVAPELNTVESVANWCSVDTRTGRLACILEENHCFDAEMYLDEAILANASDFKEDQRVNLGRWILRFLFARLIDEELERDTVYRKELMAKSSEPTSLSRQNAPPVIQLPTLSPQGTNFNANEDDTAITPRALNGIVRPSMTPGLSIGIATPHHNGVGQSPQTQNNIPTTIEEGTALEKRLSQYSQPRSSSDRQGDYFTSSPRPMSPAEGQSKAPVTPDESSLDATAQSPNNPDKEEKSKDSRWFNKKFPMNFPKKLGRSSGDSKPAVVDEKSEESDKSDDKDDKTIQDNLFGAIQKIRYKYEEDLISTPSQYLQSRMRPSTLSDTPGLQLPPYTSVIIQEERPDSGGVADLYRGAVISVGQDADLIEQKAPMWLGEILLLNTMPEKETPKVSFVLLPYEDLLQSIPSPDGNTRLNANRMLRAKKILAYVADKLGLQPAEPDLGALRPEEYLELYCQNQLVTHDTTLATLRAHVYKTSGDVVLYYKSNGRRPDLENKKINLSSEEPWAKTGPMLST